ncbi:branched-chain amino acid ABC transporter permease [Actinomadura sp. KC216]|uniref:branched-chain amino acid ABC transporter permease n=1 Tax=Actinomadura sp. KC216 TaxID=2530370 RepID=UPI00104CD6C4|nr:branched-chain amino acid ABC transporter permease [Actinomadura sp. KC216]TDB90632.1 branched-chain amino acid ABC transporter permease [Actinomadura sp. KC216]
MNARSWAVAVAALACLVVHMFTGSPLWLYLIALASTWVVIGVGSNVILGMGGVVVLHGAACMSVAAYATGIVQSHGGPWPLAVVGGTLISTVVMTVVMVPVMRLEGFFAAMSSFMIVLLVEVIMTEWKSLTNGPYGLAVPGAPAVGGLSSQQVNYLVAAVLAVASVATYAMIKASRLGVRIRAVRDARVAAQASGVDVARYRFYAFALGNAFVALGGSLMAPLLGVIDPTQFGMAAMLSVLFVTWLGGLDVPAGPVLGAAVVSILPQLLTGLQTYTGLVNGIVLLAILILCPAGLLSLGKKTTVLK